MPNAIDAICEATLKNGRPCRYKAKHGKRYCGVHAKKKTTTIQVDELECSICMCAMESNNNTTMTTRCNHTFHKTCIQRWLDTGKTTCPLCRCTVCATTRTEWAYAPPEEFDFVDNVRTFIKVCLGEEEPTLDFIRVMQWMIRRYSNLRQFYEDSWRVPIWVRTEIAILTW